MQRLRSVLGLLVVGVAIGACGDDPVEADLEPCTDDTGVVTVTVTVSGGEPLVFDWEPRCEVALLLVEEDGSDQWAIATDDATWDDPDLANRIAPPVTYGVTPAAITDTYGPNPLGEGVTYDLVLWRILPEESTAQCQRRLEAACLLALHSFTR